jgi:hypothetical protein
VARLQGAGMLFFGCILPAGLKGYYGVSGGNLNGADLILVINLEIPRLRPPFDGLAVDGS